MRSISRMWEAIRVEPPFVEGKHVGVFEVLEVPLVPVVEADKPHCVDLVRLFADDPHGRFETIWLHKHTAPFPIRHPRFLWSEPSKFATAFPDRDLETLCSEEGLGFLTKLSDGRKKATKRTRFASLTAFFNFIKNSYQSDLKNPCDSPMLRKLFRAPNQVRWDFLEKETVDEIIFKIPRIRDRLLVELMARGDVCEQIRNPY